MDIWTFVLIRLEEGLLWNRLTQDERCELILVAKESLNLKARHS